MKRIVISLQIIVVCVFFISCSASHEISFIGKPGTEIYTPDMRKLGEVSNSGNVKIVIHDDDYHAFLLSRENGSHRFVPFAMNYERNHHTIIKTAWLGCGIMGAIVLGGAFPEGAPFSFTLGFEGGALLGSLAFLNPQVKTDQYDFNYNYLSAQKVNDDLALSPLIQTADYKTISKRGKTKIAKQQEEVVQAQVSKKDISETVTEKATVGNGSEVIASKPKKQTTSSSANYSSQIAGTYIGKGKLINSGDVIDRYNNIKVVISQKSENTVSVNVIMGNGLPYFRNATTYKVSKNEDNIVLKASNINSTITINDYNELEYINHNVEDKGDICTLKINADIE